MKNISSLIAVILVLSSCSIKPHIESDKAEHLLNKTIKAHGGKKYNTAHYQFVFRKKNYTFKNENDKYTYSVTYTKDGEKIKNVLDNNGILHYEGGIEMQFSERDKDKYSETLNSVIYFATLPYKLQDPAVNKKYVGTTTIKGKAYDILEIYFNQENGGKDYDDTFHYWINKKDNTIDYLAYNYTVNKGGVRFRSAYNRRVVDGIIFQDYINYKAEVGTPLIELPALFEQDKLKKLSVIATENVVNLK